MSESAHPVQRIRLVRAVAIVVSLLVAVLLVDRLRVLGAGGLGDGGLAQESGIDVGVVAGAPDAFAALDRLESALEPAGVELPDSFAREVGVLPDARDVRVSGDGLVVGYLVDDAEDSVFSRLVGSMRDKGWTVVPLGEVTGATFVKNEGSNRWILATCTPVGEATSVVMRRAIP